MYRWMDSAYDKNNKPKLEKFINDYFNNFNTVLKTYKNNKNTYNEYIRKSFISNWIEILSEKNNDSLTYYLYDEMDIIGFIYASLREKDAFINMFYFEYEDDFIKTLEIFMNVLESTLKPNSTYINIPKGYNEKKNLLMNKGFEEFIDGNDSFVLKAPLLEENKKNILKNGWNCSDK